MTQSASHQSKKTGWLCESNNFELQFQSSDERRDHIRYS